jgi:hypothetical protein
MKRREAEMKRITPGGKWLLVGLLSLVSLLSASGQGRVLYFGGNGEDQGQAIIQTVDHGYVLVGFSESYGGDNDLDVYVVRTDVDGKLVWFDVYDEGFIEHGYDVIETADQGLLIVGDIFNTVQDFPGNANVYLLRLDKRGRMLWSKQFSTSAFAQGLAICAAPGGGYAIIGRTKDTPSGRDDVLLIRVDEDGNELWTRTYGTDADERGTAIVPMGDGFAFTGYADNLLGGFGNDIILYRVDAQGEVIWMEIFGTAGNEEAHDLVLSAEGNLVITGSINDYNDAFVAKYTPNGNLLWTKSLAGGPFGDEAFAIVELPDLSLVIAGRTETSPSNTDILLAKLDKNGNLIWFRSLGDANRLETAEGLTATQSGGFAIVGYNAREVVFFNDLLMYHTDDQGNTISNHISGKVFRDQGSCQFDPNDTLLEGWLVRAQRTGGGTFFGTTDANGNYDILVDTGTYQVTLLPRAAEYWQSCAPGGFFTSLSTFYDTAHLDFPVFPAINCSYLETHVTAPYLQYCSQVEYTVHYENLGPATGANAFIEVTLGNTLEFVSSSIPGTVLGNTITFQIGDVASTSGGSFNFLTSVPCDGILVGSAALVSARIFPNTPCVNPDPNWDGSSIMVAAQCETDSIRFFLRNTGSGDMSDPKNYIIIEDQVLLYQQPYQLEAGFDLEISLPANGATYRIIAEQSEFHPGKSYPTLAVEGCTQGGTYTTGQVTQFPEDDQDPFIDIHVQEIVGSEVLPAALRGYPKGYGDSSLIAQNTDITYVLFFANTGTDTVSRIVIRDTLSAFLDPTSLVPGSSSHPCRWEVTGEGILRITFDDVQLLPGGSAADPESRGYVTFSVSQKPNIPFGSVIEHRAALFFDYYAPQITNRVVHRVGQFPQFLVVSIENPELPAGVEINVFPNPFREAAVFEVKGMELKEAELTIFDANGRIVERLEFFGNRLEYQPKNRMSSGAYFYLLKSEGRLISSGKILVR